MLDVAYVPELAFDVFSLMAAHKQGVGFMTEEEGVCFSPFGGRLRFEGDGCLLYTSPSPRDGLLSRMPSSA